MKPWLKIRYTKPTTFVQLTVPLGQGDYQTFTASVDNLMVARRLAKRGVEISGLFGSLWKSVKKVAKKIGVNKVVNLAKKALPAVARFTPPPFNLAAAGASLALNTAGDLVKVKKARDKGQRAQAAKHLEMAVRRGHAYQKIAKSRTRRRAAQQSGARLYRILVQPT